MLIGEKTPKHASVSRLSEGFGSVADDSSILISEYSQETSWTLRRSRHPDRPISFPAEIYKKKRVGKWEISGTTDDLTSLCPVKSWNAGLQMIPIQNIIPSSRVFRALNISLFFLMICYTLMGSDTRPNNCFVEYFFI